MLWTASCLLPGQCKLQQRSVSVGCPMNPARGLLGCICCPHCFCWSLAIVGATTTKDHAQPQSQYLPGKSFTTLVCGCRKKIMRSASYPASLTSSSRGCLHCHHTNLWNALGDILVNCKNVGTWSTVEVCTCSVQEGIYILSFCIENARGARAGGSFFPLVHSVLLEVTQSIWNSNCFRWNWLLNPKLFVTVSRVVAAVQPQKHWQQVYAFWLLRRKTAKMNPFR